MTVTVPVSGSVTCSRSVAAAKRVDVARTMLAECRLCAHDCAVNRLAGEFGLCHAGWDPRIFSAQTEVSDELELIPTFAIAFSGCDLRCDFCITGEPSWNPRLGEPLHVKNLVAQIKYALAEGARTVMFLGGEPTIYLPAVLQIVAALPDGVKLVWKTNAHGSAQARELLNGIFDVWLADFKFGNDTCARRLAKVPGYLRIVGENLLWADQHSELIVRHLLMPGHVECCWKSVAEWLAGYLPGVKINLRSSFWPAWHSFRHLELQQAISPAEAAKAWRIARKLGLNLIK